MAQIVKTICQMGNHAYEVVGLDVYVEDGKIVKVKGMKNHPTNNGTLPPKAFAAPQLEYDPNRLMYPLKRVGERGEGKWERISWDEALDTIAAKLKEIKEKYGPEALGWHRGQGPGWESNFDYVARFMVTYGSPNFSSHGQLCHIPRGIGHFFTYGWLPIPDWENTRCMVLWGYNPAETSLPNHMRRIIKAKERGAKLIVIDPRFSKTASKADIWVQPRPGTDGALALGMINVIIKENLYDKEFVEQWTTGFEELAKMIEDYPPEKVAEITWVPAETIRGVARMYATRKPAAMHEVNGLDQHTNVVQTARALAILRSITGNIDVPGSMVNQAENFLYRKTINLSLRDMSHEGVMRELSRSVSTHPLYFMIFYCVTPELITAIETGKPYPIRAMIVQGGDPLTSLANHNRTKEALKKLDFLAVHDIFMTHSAQIADIVLPAATFLERTLLVKYYFESAPKVDEAFYGLQNKVVEPPGECKSDMDFLSELGRRMGYEEQFPWKSVEECIDHELSPIGITVEDLRRNPEGISKKFTPQELYRKYEKFCALLPTGKIELYSKIFEQMGYDPLPTYKEPMESPISRPDLAKDYPLICGASYKPGLYIHASYRTLPWLKERMPDPWVEIDPEKAKELGISEGDMVIVESPRGSIEVRAKLHEGIDPRVVELTHGWGQAYAHGALDNLITPDVDTCPISGATGNRSFLCRVRKA